MISKDDEIHDSDDRLCHKNKKVTTSEDESSLYVPITRTKPKSVATDEGRARDTGRATGEEGRSTGGKSDGREEERREWEKGRAT